MIRFSSAAICVGVAGLALTSCGGDSTRKANDRPLADQVLELRSTGDFAQVPYRSAVEATPTSTITIDGVVQPPPSDLLVAGRVTAVEPGRSFSWPAGPQIVGRPSTRVEHKFNDPDAWISTVIVEVAIDKSSFVDDRYAGLKVVRFGLSLHSPVDVDAIRSELLAYDRVVALLVANEFTPFDQDKDLFGVLGYGEFLGFVDKVGNVVFKASDLATETNGIPQAVTVDELFSTSPTVTIKLVDGVMQYVEG